MIRPFPFLLYLFLLLSFFILNSCTGDERTQNELMPDETQMLKDSSNKSYSIASTPLSKDELGQLYVKAIQDFMQVIGQKEGLVFDTLFFGERKFGTKDDFPAVDLPARIGNTSLVLVPTGKARGKFKSQFKKTSPFINLMGWANRSDAEFIFITFYPEFAHQYDCYLNYIYNPEKKDYVLSEDRLEVLMESHGNKAPHFTIYKNGKYLGEKALN